MPGSSTTPHGTVNGYNYHGCRCDACREAKAVYCRERGYERSRRRLEYKNQWGREHRPLCECGQPKYRGSAQCDACHAAAEVEHRRAIEDAWAEGLTFPQMVERFGWKATGSTISKLRARGYDLPYRRTPEQLARMSVGAEERMAKARAARRTT